MTCSGTVPARARCCLVNTCPRCPPSDTWERTRPGFIGRSRRAASASARRSTRESSRRAYRSPVATPNRRRRRTRRRPRIRRVRFPDGCPTSTPRWRTARPPGRPWLSIPRLSWSPSSSSCTATCASLPNSTWTPCAGSSAPMPRRSSVPRRTLLFSRRLVPPEPGAPPHRGRRRRRRPD